MLRLITVLTLAAIGSALPAADGSFASPRWSPLLVGALIGLLASFTIVLSNKPLGVSTAYARISGMIGLLFAPRFTRQLAYFKETLPKVDWEVALLVGTIVGGLLAAWTGHTLTNTLLPPTWIERFGPDSAPLRIAMAIGGGFVMAVGARIAGGCTSGHGISGTIQMSVGSWIALISFFVGGMMIALPIFGR